MPSHPGISLLRTPYSCYTRNTCPYILGLLSLPTPDKLKFRHTFLLQAKRGSCSMAFLSRFCHKQGKVQARSALPSFLAFWECWIHISGQQCRRYNFSQLVYRPFPLFLIIPKNTPYFLGLGIDRNSSCFHMKHLSIDIRCSICSQVNHKWSYPFRASHV